MIGTQIGNVLRIDPARTVAGCRVYFLRPADIMGASESRNWLNAFPATLSLDYFAYFGYHITIHHGGDKSGRVNAFASLLSKEKGPLYGPVIVRSENADLYKRDHERLRAIAGIIPTDLWIPETLAADMWMDYDAYAAQAKKLGIDKSHVWSLCQPYLLPDFV